MALRIKMLMMGLGLLVVSVVAALVQSGSGIPPQPPSHFEGAAPPNVDRPIDWSRDVTTFNCAGFAFRNYRYMNLDEVRAALAGLRELKSADEPCPPGWVRIWAWDYDVRKETEDGFVETARRDGHMVAGQTSPVDGTGPEQVFCKFARGPIEMPQPPASWRPPEREFFGVNKFGKRVFTVRSNYVEKWYIAPESALQR